MMKLDNINELHESFQKLTEGIEAYSMILLDEKGTILTWNKGVERIKGYTAKEIIGQQINIFYPPIDRERKLPEKLLEEARKKGIAKHVGRRVRKNGTLFWGIIEITAIKDSNGKTIGFTKVARELNEVHDIGHYWFDNEGILHLEASPAIYTKKKIQEFRSMLFAASGGAKVCLVADLRDAILTEEGTTFSVGTVLELYKAIAFVTNNEVDQNTKNLRASLPENIPTAVFTTRQEATNWVKKFCIASR